MLNMIWLLLLVSGILVAAWHGNIEVVTTAALQAARDAVEVCLNLVGIMALWLDLENCRIRGNGQRAGQDVEAFDGKIVSQCAA